MTVEAAQEVAAPIATAKKLVKTSNGLKSSRSNQFREIVGTYDADELSEEIRKSVEKRYDYVVLDGYLAHVNSVRLRLFAYNPRVCVVCKQKADRYIFERLDPNNKSPHLNLYGKRKDGTDLLFTKDHILPKSLSGSDSQFNMQVMCEDCNHTKGHKIRKEDIPLILRQIKEGKASVLDIAKAWWSWKKKVLKCGVFQKKCSKTALARRRAAEKYYSDVFDAISGAVGTLSTKRAFIDNHVPNNKNRRSHKWKFYVDKDGGSDFVIQFRRAWQDVVCLMDGEPVQSATVDAVNQEIKKIRQKHAGKGFIKEEK